MPATRALILLGSALLHQAALPVTAQDDVTWLDSVIDMDPTGTRHASTWYKYTAPSNGATVAWFDQVKPTHSSQSSFFATNTQGFGYMGLQQVEELRPGRIFFKGYAIFSIWDKGCAHVMDESACPADQQSQVLQCGDWAVCSRFGGEGTGAKAKIVFNQWEVETAYSFLVTAEKVSVTDVAYTGYFYAPERGQWDLMAKIQVGFGSHPWYITIPGSFVEMWDDENFNDKRWAEFGPSFMATLDAPDNFQQVMTASFEYHDAQGESTNNIHAEVTADGRRFAMGFGPEYTRTVQKFQTFNLVAMSEEPAELLDWRTLKAYSKLPSGCEGGTCFLAHLNSLFWESTSKEYAPITFLICVILVLGITWCVCQLPCLNRQQAYAPPYAPGPGYSPYPPQQTPFIK